MNESKTSTILTAVAIAAVIGFIATKPNQTNPEAEFEQWKADRVIYSAELQHGPDPATWPREDRIAAGID